VLPIKDPNVLAKVQQCLLEDFKAGRRNYTIFPSRQGHALACKRHSDAPMD